MRGASEFEAVMARLRAGLEAAAEEVVKVDSMLVVAHAQTKFQGSHPRGAAHVGGAMPNIASGDLRRSITADPVSRIGAGVARTEVAPRMAYGRRVELGMFGADALGRQYRQDPHPFFTPGVEEALPEMRARNAEIVAAHQRV